MCKGSVLFTLFKASKKFRVLNQTSYHLTVRSTVSTLYLTAVFMCVIFGLVWRYCFSCKFSVSIMLVLEPTAVFSYIFTSTSQFIAPSPFLTHTIIQQCRSPFSSFSVRKGYKFRIAFLLTQAENFPIGKCAHLVKHLAQNQISEINDVCAKAADTKCRYIHCYA